MAGSTSTPIHMNEEAHQQAHDHPDHDDTSSISIVGKSKEFCMPHSVDLTLTKTDYSSLAVIDLDGKIVLHIHKDKDAIRHSRVIFQDPDGNYLLTLQKKIKSTSCRWEAFKGKKSECPLFSAKYTYSSMDPTKLLDVFLPTNTEGEASDFMVRGSCLERTFTFYTGDSNRIIAQMHNKQKDVENHKNEDKEEFILTIYPETDYAFITALFVIVSVIHKEVNLNDMAFAVSVTGVAVSVTSLVVAIADFILK